jgi:hypothetical protein
MSLLALAPSPKVTRVAPRSRFSPTATHRARTGDSPLPSCAKARRMMPLCGTMKTVRHLCCTRALPNSVEKRRFHLISFFLDRLDRLTSWLPHATAHRFSEDLPFMASREGLGPRFTPSADGAHPRAARWASWQRFFSLAVGRETTRMGW